MRVLHTLLFYFIFWVKFLQDIGINLPHVLQFLGLAGNCPG